MWLGHGPFEALAEPPQGVAFYLNDFALSDARPWKCPARMEWLEDDVAGGFGGGELPEVAWKLPEPEWFEMVFLRIRKDVVGKRLRKMVPVLTEHGVRRRGVMAELLAQVRRAPAGLWGYGRICGEEGFLGATPELLLEVKEGRLGTMALAGTASPWRAGDFASDVKEIEEHELVAGFLQKALEELGQVERSPREVSEAAGLTHFRTRLSVGLRGMVGLNALVKLLHPTPAVGCLPRDEATMAKLMECRRILRTPPFFGAPFGLKTEESFHAVVGIRGLGWQGDEVSMPSGCGVVGGSVFDHEWRELRLKREAVARMLGV